ncbi:MAG: hypothetical protein GY805_11240 [Chloroflexi bacterium]|nr:hypothetical protein [Chloroflexota bacterium]
MLAILLPIGCRFEMFVGTAVSDKEPGWDNNKPGGLRLPPGVMSKRSRFMCLAISIIYFPSTALTTLVCGRFCQILHRAQVREAGQPVNGILGQRETERPFCVD